MSTYCRIAATAVVPRQSAVLAFSQENSSNVSEINVLQEMVVECGPCPLVLVFELVVVSPAFCK